MDFAAETDAFSSPCPISLVADSDWSSDWQSFNLVVDQTGLELPPLQRPSLPEMHRQVDTEAYNDSTHCHRCGARWDVVGDAADAAYNQWTGWDRSGSSYYQGQRAQWPKAARQMEMGRQWQKPPTQAEECRAEARHTQEAGSRTIAADASTSSDLYGRRNYMDASCTADGTSGGSSGCNGTSSSCRFQLCPTSRIQAFDRLPEKKPKHSATTRRTC